MLQIQDKRLWQVGGFASFAKWLASVSEIRTPQTAFNMMSVARALNKNTAARFGPSICYVIAKASDEDARKELTRLAADGATTTELKLVAREQREERSIVSKSPGRPKKEVERAVKVNGMNGQEKVVVPVTEVKASARARKRENVGVKAGETGLVQLTVQTVKSKTKAGWALVAQFQLGENGPDIRVQVNSQNKQLKYEVM